MRKNRLKNNKKINEKCTEKEIQEIWSENKFDANGSYVGTGLLGTEPVQDADDL